MAAYERKDFWGGGWEPIDEKTMRRKFENFFDDVDLAIGSMVDGSEVHTPYAQYRLRKEE